MDDGLKTAFYLLAPLAVISLFLPLVTNPAPKDCNNYSDGTGGYYLKCKDEYISIYARNKMKRNTPAPAATTTESATSEVNNESTHGGDVSAESVTIPIEGTTSNESN